MHTAIKPTQLLEEKKKVGFRELVLIAFFYHCSSFSIFRWGSRYTDDGEIYSRIPPIFLRNAHAILLCKENPMKASTLKFELELGIECQGLVQNILLLWFIQGIFKSCWASATTAVASTYSRTELDVGVVLC